MKKLLLFTLLGLCFLLGCSNSSTNDNYVEDDTYEDSYNRDSSTNNNYVTDNDSIYTYEDSYNRKNANYITVKYRDTLVDVSGFESFDTSKSSFIRSAYYDWGNQYLILNLDGTYYHWCGVPSYIWEEFKEADSLGKYYNQYIKGEYDCRLGYVPQYN